jgi:hypothetical protein
MLNSKPFKLSKSGMAIIETLPMLVVFTLILNFAFGFYGVIQSALLNTIACRNYAFETFNNRTNLTYFRDNPGSANPAYYKMGSRFHAVVSEKLPSGSDLFYATERKIDLLGISDAAGDSAALHNEDNSELNQISSLQPGEKYEGEGASPVWVKTMCGICITARCGG